jgi:uncharacterized protein
MMEIEAAHVIAAVVATAMIGFVKGAFGGGFGLVGIPILSLVMDPVTAGTIVAPLFIPMDVVALRYYPPRTWSIPDLKVLLPAMALGIGLGTLTLALLDVRLVSIAIAVVALLFAAHWYAGGGRITTAPRNTILAALAGTASGVATMVAHSGTPPLAMYLLRMGLAKEVYVGTTTIYFAVGNLIKVGPWLMLGQPTPAVWTLIAICVPVAMIFVWIGWLFHKRIDQKRLYQGCYAILVLTSLKLLWDGIKGFL